MATNESAQGALASIEPAALTKKQAHEYIGCKLSKLEQYVSAGRLPVLRHGRRVVIRRTELDRLLDELEQEAAVTEAATT